MNTQLLEKVEKNNRKEDITAFRVGDTIKVQTRIREGEKQRLQTFTGIVIARKSSGTRSTFTVRRISSGVGVEKIFPLHSPNIASIEVTAEGSVRRAKLYYMRERIGKKAMFIKKKTA